jgi:hypothetical protein
LYNNRLRDETRIFSCEQYSNKIENVLASPSALS